LIVVFELNDLSDAPIDQSITFRGFLAEDSVGFARSCLSISEDSSIIAIEQLLAHMRSNIVEDSLLLDFLVENFIEAEIVLINFDGFRVKNLQYLSLLLLSCFRLQSHKHLYVLLSS
jgi:hypothetical protein